MAARPNPYVKKDPGDIMLAADWNEMQVQTREELRGHRHAGGADADPIAREGIAPNAVDGSRIDPQSDVALKALRVNGRVVLAEIDALLASVNGLKSNPLVLQKDLQVGGRTRLNAQVDIAGPLTVTGATTLNGALGVTGDATIIGNLTARSGAIRLSLENNGGGQLVLTNNPNDNRIYLEAFNRNNNGSATEMLLTGAGATAVPQLTLVADKTVATGAVYVGNSDLYFTKTDHNHSGIGNTAGYAAIENAANWDALMLLGRANGQHPTKPGVKMRMVKLWDFLDVNGEMRVTGPFMEVNGGGNERCYIGGDGAGNDVQVGSLSPSVTVVAMWNTVNGYMTVNCKSLNQASDLALKDDVAPLSGSLQRILALRGVSYNLKAELEGATAADPDPGRHLGFIAQEVQPIVPEAVSESRGLLNLSYTSIIPLLVEAIKEQQAMIDELRKALPPAGLKPQRKAS